MIDAAATRTLWTRLFFRVAWGSEEKIARKLLEFSATERGSALDMVKASELTDDPTLRRLFFRHALDEARHARVFSDAARSLATTSKMRPYADRHAKRQDLYERLPLLQFLEFVLRAERSGQSQFQELAARFSDRAELCDLFTSIEKDERFHVAYSARYLTKARKEAGLFACLLASLRIRVRSLSDGARRGGRRVADLISGAFLLAAYFTIVPPFALLNRIFESDSTPRWRRPAGRVSKRGQYS